MRRASYVSLEGAVIGTQRQFNFHYYGQPVRDDLILVHNETLSVAAMSVGDPDRSPFAIQSCDAASAPSGFAESVTNYFPRLQAQRLLFLAGFLESGIGTQSVP